MLPRLIGGHETSLPPVSSEEIDDSRCPDADGTLPKAVFLSEIPPGMLAGRVNRSCGSIVVVYDDGNAVRRRRV